MAEEPGLIDQFKDKVAQAGKFAEDFGNSVSGTESERQGRQHERDQREYDYDYMSYPSDLGLRRRHPYFITFYINKQKLSSFKTESSEAAMINNRPILSTAQINATQTRNIQRNIKGTNVGFGRKTQRTKAAIRLFMPDTLSWSFSNGYKDASLSAIPGMGVAQAISSAPALYRSSTEAAKKGGLAGVLASLQSPAARAAGGVVAETLGEVSGQGAELGASFLGLAVNPQIDVIYISPELRQFTFDFLFAPKSADDAQTIRNIIKEFKFHSAPEMLGGKGIGLGRYYVPPAEFDIKFSVSTMGKISTCVLQNITVDYAPSGAAFYSDESPVNTRMTLQFKELEFITKHLVEKGF